MKSDNFIPYTPLPYDSAESADRSAEFRAYMDRRRSVRAFSDKPISKSVIEDLIMAASTAPSGAHKQPWTFCAVSSAEMKAKIRAAAEKEEYESYNGRMTQDWLDDLKQFNTNWEKEFLTICPWLIVVFKKAYDVKEDGSKAKNYYVNESVGIACGFLLAAIHNAGLVSLTHTPSPMNFLQKVLDRPVNERPYLLIPVGYPADEAEVPDIQRKGLDDVAVWY